VSFLRQHRYVVAAKIAYIDFALIFANTALETAAA